MFHYTNTISIQDFQRVMLPKWMNVDDFKYQDCPKLDVRELNWWEAQKARSIIKKTSFFFNIMENVLVSQLGFPKNINYLEYLIFATSAGLKIVTFLLVRPKNLPDFIRGSHRPVGWQFHFFPPKTLLQCWVGNSLWL